ncbi:hypothetical protein DV454_003988 [Geotrichum candidum]|nr:hypothetical protein DV454_003988 [Geotrichum candidum]
MADLNRLSASLTGLKEIVEADKDTNSVDDDEHQARLEQELEQIRQVNDVTEGVIESLKVTELNLDVRNVLMGAQNADKLLDKWVRILSQTEHTQRLLFNKGWHGATRDDEMQQERERQLEAERRRAQERERERQTREAEERRRREAHEEQRRAKESGLQRRGISKRSVAGSSSVGASSSSSSSGTAGVRKTPAGSARKPPAGTGRTNLRSRPSTIPRPVPRR